MVTPRTYRADVVKTSTESNMSEPIEAFIRLRDEINQLGSDELARRAIERGDPETLWKLIEVLQLTSPEAVDLITAYAMLCHRGAGAPAIETWKRRVSAFLLRHIGETPEPERLLAN
jgi:hypothetical protein